MHPLRSSAAMCWRSSCPCANATLLLMAVNSESAFQRIAACCGVLECVAVSCRKLLFELPLCERHLAAHSGESADGPGMKGGGRRKKYLCVYFCMHRCMYMKMHAHTCIYICKYIDIHICINMHVYKHIYIYIYIHIYMYVYKYIHIFTCIS